MPEKHAHGLFPGSYHLNHAACYQTNHKKINSGIEIAITFGSAGWVHLCPVRILLKAIVKF